MIVVDSSVWIDYFNGNITKQTNLLDSLFGSELIVIGDLILTEVLQGFGGRQRFQQGQEAARFSYFQADAWKRDSRQKCQELPHFEKKGHDG